MTPTASDYQAVGIEPCAPPTTCSGTESCAKLYFVGIIASTKCGIAVAEEQNDCGDGLSEYTALWRRVVEYVNSITSFRRRCRVSDGGLMQARNAVVIESSLGIVVCLVVGVVEENVMAGCGYVLFQ